MSSMQHRWTCGKAINGRLNTQIIALPQRVTMTNNEKQSDTQLTEGKVSGSHHSGCDSIKTSARLLVKDRKLAEQPRSECTLIKINANESSTTGASGISKYSKCDHGKCDVEALTKCMKFHVANRIHLINYLGSSKVTRYPDLNGPLISSVGRRVHAKRSPASRLSRCKVHHRTKTKCQLARSQQHSSHHFGLIHAVRWAITQIAIIYTTIDSLTPNTSFKLAQASSAPIRHGANHWPLSNNQYRYQQLFFTGTHAQPPASGNAQLVSLIEAPSVQRLQSAIQQVTQQTPLVQAPVLRQQTLAHSAEAVEAAAAAIAATANAAQARKSRRHNLLIGQNFHNFSTIVPYGILHDVDYGPMQEDPIINEQQAIELSPNGQPFEDQSPSSRGANIAANSMVGLETPLQAVEMYSNDQASYKEQQQPEESEAHSASALLAASKNQPIPVSIKTRTLEAGNKKQSANERALLPLDSNRLILPQMQQIKARFNQGCVGGTKCQFFAFCWMSGGSLGASCGLLMTCCVTPSRQEIQPGFYGPVVNDPYCGRSTNKINRIVGGTDASFGQFPWQAFVQVGGSRCGGALISSRHVVTAGHCVARSQHTPSSIKVTLGDYILNSDIESIPHEVYSVVEVLLHPNFRFTPQADRYDVAVLELDRAASYKDNIKPICLPQKDATFVGRVAYVAGWGALQAGSKLRPKVLQHVAVPVIENNVCESWHRRKGIDIRIYDEMMCAGYELGQRDACQGDSGGPLMLNQFGVWYLVGIVSAGYSCAKQYQPGIYHRVSSSSDWISSNVYQQGNGN